MLFFVVWIVVTVSVTRQSQTYSDLGAHGEFSSPIPTGTSICRLDRVPVNQEEKGKPFADVVHKHTARWTPIRKPWTCQITPKSSFRRAKKKSVDSSIHTQHQKMTIITHFGRNLPEPCPETVSQTLSEMCEWTFRSICSWSALVAWWYFCSTAVSENGVYRSISPILAPLYPIISN